MYIGNDLQVAFPSYRNIDNISGSFNGVTTSFALLINGSAPVPPPLSSNQCLISINGVIQKPDDTGASGFRLSGGNIVFSSAPAGGATFFGVVLAGADYVNAGVNFPDGSVGAPSITFDQDNDTGYYRSASGAISFSSNGVASGTWNASGITAPALSPTGSTVPTNGVYLPAANNVAISTNGTGRLFVSSDGNIGLGTATPANYANYRNLAINGTTGANIDLLSNGTKVGNLFNDGTNFYAYNVVAGSLVFGTNNTERMRLDSSGRLGLGTSSPSALLHLVNGDALQIIENSAATSNASLQLKYPSRTWSIANRGADLSGSLTFRDITAGADRVVINSSGNVGIGTTSPTGLLDVNGSLGAVRVSTGGHELDFTRNGVNYIRASAGSSSELFYQARTHRFNNVDGTSEYGRFDTSGRLLVGTTTAVSNGGVLQVSNGITFPATQSACTDPNTLDDYEEGSWTPTTNSTGGISVDGTPRYTKIGRQVTININSVTFPAATGGGTLSLGGLPFVCDSSNNGTAALVCNNSNMQRILVVASTSTVFFYPNANTTTTNVTNGTSGTTTVYGLSCTYFVP